MLLEASVTLFQILDFHSAGREEFELAKPVGTVWYLQ
jgi:hypothetical protein